MSESPAYPGRSALRALLSLTLLLAVVVLLPIALPIGCLEETSVEPGIEHQIGVLEGYVLSGGEPMRGRVTAWIPGRIVYSEEDRVAECTTDTLGLYRMVLPVGAYRLRVDGVDVMDSVQVYPIARRLDLWLGRVVVRLSHAGALNGTSVEIDLVRDWYGSSGAAGVVRDGDLEVVFPVLKPGRYSVRIGYGVGRWWLPGTREYGESEVIIVPVDRTVTIQASMDRLAVLSGRSVPCPGPVLWYPTIVAIDADSTEIGWAETRTDGSFRLDLLDARPVKLRTLDGGWIGGRTYEEAEVFAPGPGERIDDIALRAGGIRVELGGPGFYAGQYATIRVVDEQGGSIVEPVRSGMALLCGLPPGRYRIHISGSCSHPWIAQWFDGAVSEEEATWVDVVDGETTIVIARVAGGGSIRGRAVHSGFRQRVEFSIHDSAGVLLCEPRGSLDGLFTFNGLENGLYYLALRCLSYDSPPGEWWWYPGTAVFDSARVVRIDNHETITGIEWPCPEE